MRLTKTCPCFCAERPGPTTDRARITMAIRHTLRRIVTSFTETSHVDEHPRFGRELDDTSRLLVRTRWLGGRAPTALAQASIVLSRRFDEELSRRAGGGIPPRRVGKLLEVRCRQVRSSEVLRILDSCGHREPLIAVRHRVDVVVLGHHRLAAVRGAVLAHVA